MHLHKWILLKIIVLSSTGGSRQSDCLNNQPSIEKTVLASTGNTGRYLKLTLNLQFLHCIQLEEAYQSYIIPVLGGLLALSTVIILILSLAMIAVCRKKGKILITWSQFKFLLSVKTKSTRFSDPQLNNITVTTKEDPAYEIMQMSMPTTNNYYSKAVSVGVNDTAIYDVPNI